MRFKRINWIVWPILKLSNEYKKQDVNSIKGFVRNWYFIGLSWFMLRLVSRIYQYLWLISEMSQNLMIAIKVERNEQSEMFSKLFTEEP